MNPLIDIPIGIRTVQDLVAYLDAADNPGAAWESAGRQLLPIAFAKCEVLIAERDTLLVKVAELLKNEVE